MVIVAVHAAAAVLLVIGGAAKIARPDTAANLFETLGLSPSKLVTLMTRGLGVFEIALGAIALAVGGVWPAAAVAFAYMVFAAATFTAITEGATDCGCFGMRHVPPSWLHVVIDLGLATASFNAVIRSPPLEVMGDQPAGGAGFVALAGAVAGVLLVLFTAAPKALRKRRPERIDALPTDTDPL